MSISPFTEFHQTRDLAGLLDAIPYARFMGFEVADEPAVLKMRFQDHLIGRVVPQRLHGGTIGALLEWAGIFGLAQNLDELHGLPKTITFTVDYMRGGDPQDTYASANIIRTGRRTANVQCFAWQDGPDRPIASAKINFMLAEPPAAKGEKS